MRALVLCRLEPGLDDGALIGAFQRLQLDTAYIDDEKFVYPRWGASLPLRIGRSLLRKSARALFNRHIRATATFMSPDIVFIFGGAAVEPLTVRHCQSLGARVYFFYPDTTFGLPRAYPRLWDDAVSYTTKPNWPDLARLAGVIAKPKFVFPWYDPQYLRRYSETEDELETDILFIGHASVHKRHVLEHLVERFQNVYRITVIGEGWSYLPATVRKSNVPIYGSYANSLYARAAITLGLLEDLGGGVKDLITARTIQAPAYGGCLIHPRNHVSEELFGKADFLYRDEPNCQHLHEVVQLAMECHVRRKAWALLQNQRVSEYSVDNVISGVITCDDDKVD